ncbi:murein L,D-transpeptidase family protein [Paracoccus aerius]
MYHITHRNPRSSFFLSLGISYPNAQDRARAHALGRDPGGDIFIHGRGPRVRNPPRDWTRGCAAVTDREMAEIFDLVAPGTPIFIKP